jgi:biotin transporter BioY
MEFIIAWILFGVAAGYLAKEKKRTVVLWVIIGLLIGPFALLIIGLMKPGSVGAKGPE